MNKKVVSSFFVFSILAVSLASCSNKGYSNFDDAKLSSELTKIDLPLINHSSMYNLKDDKITTYFFKDGHVPYVGINEFIDSLDGYFISDDFNFFINNRRKTGSVDLTINDYKYWFDLDCKKETIKSNDTSMFNHINSPEGINYSGHFKLTKIEKYIGQHVYFDLKSYEYNLLIKDNDIIVPFDVLNFLLLSPNVSNVAFNGKEFHFFGNYIQDTKDFASIRNQDVAGKEIPQDLIEARNNGLFFVLDNFYGLKEYYKISSFKELVSLDTEMYEKLYSSNPKDFSIGLKKLLIDRLDDPHTSMVFKSIYNEIKSSGKEIIYSSSEYSGKRVTSILNTYNNLIEDVQNKFGEDYYFKTLDDTDYFRFSEFSVGYDDDIYNEDGSIKPDAYKYDTFYLFQKYFNEIKQNGAIKNVVIDLTCNLGGSIASCINAIGYLTDNLIKVPERDITSNERLISSYKVDSDSDGDFNDNDSYDTYNYYVLTSNATFSCGNLFTSICKDLGIAKIIGEQSGGGMCYVQPVLLLDGTYLNISGPGQMKSAKEVKNGYELYDIEGGIEIDYKVPSDKFYDFNYINNLIDNID